MNFYQKKEKNKGFTLTELLVVIAIFTTISGVVFALGRDTFFLNGIVQDSFNAQEEAKRLIRPISNEIRTMSIGNNGSYPLDFTGTSTISFYSDIDADGNREKVRYFLSNDILKKGTIKPTGSPSVYATSTETIVELIHGVRNSADQPIFQYFDNQYFGTGNPLTYPINVSSVTLIKINIYIDSNPDRAPFKQNITTQINLRNLRNH